MDLHKTQNSPAEAAVCFSPTPSRLVHFAAPTARRQGPQAYPLTVLVCAACALQRDGSGGSRHPKTRVATTPSSYFIHLRMGIFNCRHVHI